MPAGHPCAGHRGARARRALKPPERTFLTAGSKPARRACTRRPAPFLERPSDMKSNSLAVRAAFMAAVRGPAAAAGRAGPEHRHRQRQGRAQVARRHAAAAGRTRRPEGGARSWKPRPSDQVVLREIFTQEAEKTRHRRLGRLPRADGTGAPEHPDPRAVRGLSRRRTRSATPKPRPSTTSSRPRSPAPSTAPATSWSRSEDEAKALIAQIKGGAKFEDLAKKNSKDPGSGANGGDLDFAKADSYVPEFGQALTKLKKGEMTADAGEDASSAGTSSSSKTRARPQFPAFDDVKAADHAAAGADQAAAVPGRPAQGRQDRLQVRAAVSASGFRGR